MALNPSYETEILFELNALPAGGSPEALVFTGNGLGAGALLLGGLMYWSDRRQCVRA